METKGSCTAEEIATNTCSLDVNKVLCIKWACDDTNYSPDITNNPNVLVQDIFLTATMLIGTVVTLVLVVSGVRYIIAGSGDSAQASSAKKWIQNAIIWLIIVTFSYTIVRVIQYIVAWYK